MNNLDQQRAQDRADEADTDHHNMIVEYVGSDPLDSGGCLGLIAIMFAVGTIAKLLF
jgi:hypothetical protein